MFGNGKLRKEVAAVRDEVAELKASLASTSLQLATLADQLSAVTADLALLATRSGGQDDILNQFSFRVSGIAATTTRQAGALDRHSQQLASFGGDLISQGEILRSQEARIRQFSADVEQLGRQAEIDNREMRRNYAAVAETIVQTRLSKVQNR